MSPPERLKGRQYFFKELDNYYEVNTQEEKGKFGFCTLTKDLQLIQVWGSYNFKVVNSMNAVLNVARYKENIELLCCVFVRDAVGQSTFKEFRFNRPKLNDIIKVIYISSSSSSSSSK